MDRSLKAGIALFVASVLIVSTLVVLDVYTNDDGSDTETSEYSVTYYLNGGTGTIPAESDKTAEELFNIALSTDLTPPDGKIFREWNTSADGTGTSYTAGSEVSMPAENLKLYAIWGYEVIGGGTGGWCGSLDGYTMVIDVDHSKFIGLNLDGVPVDKSNYTSSSGSTIVTLNPDYLATLEDGEYSLEVLFDDGSASFTLQIFANAKAAILTELDELLDEYEEDDYSTANWAAILGVINDAKAEVDAFTEISEVTEYDVGAVKDSCDGVKTLVQELDDEKAIKIGKLDTLLGTYDEDDYSAENWTTLTGYVDAAKTAVNGFTEISQVTGFDVDAVETQCDGVKTLVQELDDEKAIKIGKLDKLLGTYDEDDYSEANWAILAGIISDAKDDVDAFTEISQVTGFDVDAVKDSCDEVETLAQIKASLLSELQNKIDELNNGTEGVVATLNGQDISVEFADDVDISKVVTAAGEFVTALEKVFGTGSTLTVKGVNFTLGSVDISLLAETLLEGVDPQEFLNGGESITAAYSAGVEYKNTTINLAGNLEFTVKKNL